VGQFPTTQGRSTSWAVNSDWRPYLSQSSSVFAARPWRASPYRYDLGLTTKNGRLRTIFSII